MKQLQKILAAVLVLTLVLAMAACGKKQAATQNTEPEKPAGTLQLLSDIQVDIHYDKKGNVLTAEGNSALLPEDLAGKSCSEVVKFVLESLFVDNAVPYGPFVLIRQIPGSATPDDSFLSGILVEAKAVTGEYPTFLVAADELDEMGLFSVETAKAILLAWLENPENAQLDANGNAVTGKYAISCTLDGTTVNYMVDGQTGSVELYTLDPEQDADLFEVVPEGLPDEPTTSEEPPEEPAVEDAPIEDADA